MDKNKIDEVAFSLGEIYERIQNSFMHISTKQLLKGIKSPNDWAIYQYSNLNRFRERLTAMASIYIKYLNKAWEKALLISYAEAEKTEYKIDNERKTLNIKYPEIVKQKMQVIESQTATQVDILKREVERIHQMQISNVSYRYTTDINSIVNQQEISPLTKTQKVYNLIKDVSETMGVENAPKVNYKTKDYVSRQVTWKSWAEMNARTTLNQEAHDHQLRAGGELGIVFYLCSQHADCAKDHIDYQGKIYYDNRYSSYGFSEDIIEKIEDYISSNNCMSRQEVEENEPYLGSRPNCRHYFEPVPMMDLLEGKTNAKKALKELSMDKGKADEDLYNDTQTQRYNERMIRKWKEKRDKQELIVNASPDGESKTNEQLRLDKYNAKVKAWQQTQRELLKSNSSLERNYDRESYKTVVEDLGYKVGL